MGRACHTKGKRDNKGSRKQPSLYTGAYENKKSLTGESRGFARFDVRDIRAELGSFNRTYRPVHGGGVSQLYLF